MRTIANEDPIGYLIAGIQVDTRKSSEIFYRISTRETLPNHCSNNQPLVLFCFVLFVKPKDGQLDLRTL